MLDFSATEQGRTVGRVCLCGVGSAGTKVMEEALTLAPQGVSVCAMNPDARALNASTIPVKVHLGPHLTRGLGTGGNERVGREAALESEAAILRAVEGASLVVIAAGLGGGTGSGVAPEVARLAKESGAYVVSVIITPFRFEGERRLAIADEALRSLSMYSDMVMRFDNDAMEGLIDADKGVMEAFSAVNVLLARAVMIVPGLLESEGGLLQVGLDDLIAVVGSGRGICSFGMTTASPDEDVSSVLERLVKSPLFLQKHLSASDEVLVLMRGNDTLTLSRMEALMRGVYDMLGGHGQLHIGVSVCKDATDEVSITVLGVVPCELVTPVPEPAPEPSQTPEPELPVTPVVTEQGALAPEVEPAPVREELPAEAEENPSESEEASHPETDSAPFMEDEDELEEAPRPAPLPDAAPVVMVSRPEPDTMEEQTPESTDSITNTSEDDSSVEDEEPVLKERGMFSAVSPNLFDGEDLDLPPALRKKKPEQE